MQFAVRTLAPDMTIASVVVDASDEADARRQVEARGLYVSAVEPARGAGFFVHARRSAALASAAISFWLLRRSSFGSPA